VLGFIEKTESFHPVLLSVVDVFLLNREGHKLFKSRLLLLLLGYYYHLFVSQATHSVTKEKERWEKGERKKVKFAFHFAIVRQKNTA
jgi:hypothetical protein